MDFTLTDGQENIRQMLRWLADSKIRKVSLEADQVGAFPDELLLEMQTMGVSLGGNAAEEMMESAGGRAGQERQGNRTAAIACEELAYGDAALLLALPGPGLGGPPLRFTGTPEQKKRFLEVFERPGELHYGAYALTEPGAGSDVSGLKTTCVKDGDHYVLNGTKCFITNGAKADWVVAFATIDKSLGRAGHRAFVVERGTPGFSVGKIEKKMGLRASETAELVFEDCRVPAENLLGGEARYQDKQGFLTAMKTFDNTRPMVAAMALGIGRAAFERAREFVKEAYVLSRPIPRYAAIRELLGRTERRLHASRLLVWKAVSMADEGVPNTKEASMAKAHAARAAQQATIDAIEIMGAAGHHRDAFVEKWFRDVKVYDIFEGTGQIQRVVIAKRLFDFIEAF